MSRTVRRALECLARAGWTCAFGDLIMSGGMDGQAARQSQVLYPYLKVLHNGGTSSKPFPSRPAR
jgi:hypothetical protein